MAIPAAIMDSKIWKRLVMLEGYVGSLEARIQTLEKEVRILRLRTLPPPPKSKAKRSTIS